MKITGGQHLYYVLRANRLTAAAFAVAIFIFLVAIVGPFITPYDPLESNVASALQPPSALHWFGTDQIGRDVFSRVVVATRLDIFIALSAVALSFVIGASIGAMCGYLGGWIDRWISRMVDVLMAFPLFVLAMALVAALGNKVENVIYATMLINLPFYVRYARVEVNVQRTRGFVDAARVSGNGDARILFRFLLPNVLPGMMVQISLNMGWAILNAAGLSFIGLGIRPPAPEWGIMVAEGARFITTGQWWTVLFPSLALVTTVLAFNLLGDGLRDMVDPKLRT